MILKVIIAAIILMIIALLAMIGPDIKRYMRLRSM